MSIVIGLDRDGTINEDLGTYVTRVDDFLPIKGSLEAITDISDKGYKIVIITNQAGIFKGLMTPDDVDKIHERLLELLGQAGCRKIDGIYYSTTNLKEDFFAKPNIGMFKRAEEDLKIDFKNGIYVGDKITDLKAAEKIGAVPVLVKTGYGLKTLEELNRYANRKLKKKTLVFDDLKKFSEYLPKIF